LKKIFRQCENLYARTEVEQAVVDGVAGEPDDVQQEEVEVEADNTGKIIFAGKF
jgi:hypothetical protein